jgi:hypothetical protein
MLVTEVNHGNVAQNVLQVVEDSKLDLDAGYPK